MTGNSPKDSLLIRSAMNVIKILHILSYKLYTLSFIRDSFIRNQMAKKISVLEAMS